MNYLYSLNSIVLFGGKCELDPHSNQHCSQDLNDFWILRLRTLTWQELNIRGNIPSPRAHHCSAVFGSQLIIYGGMGGG
jgi:hypothetical protein